MSVADADTSANGSSPSSRNGEKGAGAVAETISRGEENEPVPHLHAKTYLAVFTVTVIYYAQLVNLVGAGAVRDRSSRRRLLIPCAASRDSVS